MFGCPLKQARRDIVRMCGIADSPSWDVPAVWIGANISWATADRISSDPQSRGGALGPAGRFARPVRVMFGAEHVQIVPPDAQPGW
jgi:hypothetical protein